MSVQTIQAVSEQALQSAGITRSESTKLYPANHKHGDSGLPLLVIENAKCRLVIALQGAHILAFLPKSRAEMLWVSPKSLMEAGKPIRGGIPLCLPWFGPSNDGKVMHGFARNLKWTPTQVTLLASGETQLTMELAGEALSDYWPHAFHFSLEILAGSELSLKLKAKNAGKQGAPLSFAFHTYFAVSDVKQAAVGGLEGCTYLDKMDNMARKTQSGEVTIDSVTDRVYLDVPYRQQLKTGTHEIQIGSASKGAVVWNAWHNDKNIPDLGEGNHKNYLCVERGDMADHAVNLPAGGQYEMEMKLSYCS